MVNESQISKMLDLGTLWYLKGETLAIIDLAT
jgi:hypothetical protein